MGRHSEPVVRARVPSSLLGWGVFCCLVAGATVWWFGRSWTTTLAVTGLGLLALGTLALAVMSASPRARRRPPP